MNNSSISLYQSNNQTDPVNRNGDRSGSILSTLDEKTLAICQRIYNKALSNFGVFANSKEFANDKKDIILSEQDKRKIEAAAYGQEKPVHYLKKEGALNVKFLNESKSPKSKTKKKKSSEDQQIATDNLIHELKTQKRIIEDFLAGSRLGEPEREIIKEILEEEAGNHSTTEDIKPILKSYLMFLDQKIESLNKCSIDDDHRKLIHQILAKNALMKKYEKIFTRHIYHSVVC